jgi:hypothetical protein
LSTHLVNLVDSAGKDTSVLEDCGASGHSVCFTGTGLAVAEDSTIKAVNNGADNLVGSLFITFVLRSVMENLFELEFPHISLIID